MAFLGHIRPKKFQSTASCLVKCCSQIFGVTTFGSHISSRWTIRDLESPSFVIHQAPSEIHLAARFFAAPVQAKLKPEVKDSQGPRLNNAITAQFVRLVTDEGHSVVSRQEALNRAMKLKLDLVEVQRQTNPPVCKIMDYHRERYKQQLKEKDRTKSKTTGALRNDCKEVRFTGKIEQKDLQMKANMAKRLMERGYRVKCMAMGKEEEDLGGLLSRFTPLIEDVAIVESGPMVERSQAYVLVRHIKFGLPKKAGKNAVMTMGMVSKEINKVTSSGTAKGAGPLEIQIDVGEDLVATISESDIDDAKQSVEEEEYDELLQESPEMPFNDAIEKPMENFSEQNSWSTFESSDNFDKVFGFFDDTKGQDKKDSNATSPHEVVNDFTRILSHKPPVSPEFNVRNSNPNVGVGGAQRHTSPPVHKSAFDRMKPFPQPIELVSGPQKHTSPPILKSAFDQMKPLPRPIESGRRSNIDQSLENLDKSPVRNFKQSPVVDTRRGSDAKQGQKLSSYGIFSAPKPGATSDQQIPKNMNTQRGQSPQNPMADALNAEDDRSTQGRWGIFSGQPPDPNQQRPTSSPFKNNR